MVGKAKEYFEIVESTNPGDYERILPEIQEYANRRRLEANLKHESKGHAMDVGNVDTHDHGQEWSNNWGDEANDMNAVGKGKGWKGKGKGGGGKAYGYNPAYMYPGYGMQDGKGYQGK